MKAFLTNTLTLDRAAREKMEHLRQVQRELEAEQAAVARRCDAIVVAAARASKLDLAACGPEVLLGHLVHLCAKIEDATFKKMAAERAATFLEDFQSELKIRGSSVAYAIDPDIDMASSVPVPVIARLLRNATAEETKKLTDAGMVIKIKFSNRSPAMLLEGNLVPGAIIELAESMDVRFDLRPDHAGNNTLPDQADSVADDNG